MCRDFFKLRSLTCKLRFLNTILTQLGLLRFARGLLMMVRPRGTSAASGLEITAELIVVIDRIAIGRCGTVSASSFFGTVSSFGCAWDFVCSSRVFLSTVLAQDPGREPHDWMIRIYHHTSQLRANSERAPLNSPSVSGHRLLCASLLVFSYLPLGRCCCCRRRVSCFVCSSAQTPLSGAAPLFSSAPALLFRCAWRGGGVCRRRPAARNRRQGRVAVSTGR